MFYTKEKGVTRMLIEVDFNSDEAIYIQLRNQIIMGIATDRIREGDTLPSVRQMAEYVGINMHTVNKAYAVLRDEGFLMMRGRAGAVVADFRRTASPERQAAGTEKIEEALYQLALEHRAQGGSCRSFLTIASEQAKRVFDAAVSDTSTEGA